MSSRRPASRRTAPDRRRWAALGVAAVVAIAAVAGLIALGSRSGDATSKTAPTLPAGVTAQGKSLGNPSAPVAVEVFSDFLCSFCGEFTRGPERRIIDRYVTAGQVRILYYHFPLFGLPSLEAAAAGECAAAQDRFWPYHDIVFANQGQDAERSGFGVDRLVRFAEQVGMDGGKFRACMDEPAPREAVGVDAAEGRRRGVNATPTFFINGERVDGNNEQGIVAAIERALRR